MRSQGAVSPSELALAHCADFESRGVVELNGLPSHALVGRSRPNLALYILHANDSFIADPVRFQIRNATTGPSEAARP